MNYRIFFISFFCLIVSCTFAQNSRYSLYKYNGKISVKTKRPKTDWKNPTAKMQLDGIDCILIRKGAEVKILENSTNKIFKSSTPGTYSVRMIVEAAKKQSSSSVTEVAKEVTGRLETSERTNHYEQMFGSTHTTGAARRSITNQDCFEDSIGAVLLNYAALEVENNLSGYDKNLVLTKVPVDGDFVFKISNKNDFPVCANILTVNHETGICSLAIDIDDDKREESTNLPYLLIDRNESITLSDYEFSETTRKTSYIVFCTKRVFNSHDLSNILNGEKINKSSLVVDGIMYNKTKK